MKIINLFKKFLAKKEEKESIEKFLCTLTDPQPCKKISWMGFFKSFKQDTKENRILKIDDEYTMKDYFDNINKEYPFVEAVNNNFKEVVNKPEYQNTIKVKYGTKEKGFKK
jgi:hypothetical protein